METKKKSNFYKLLIFSLVLLINPTINVIDLLPDFISWFILANLFAKAADSAPYFEEARSAFVKLGYINLAKTLGLIIIIFVKSRDMSDNNIFPLVSLAFGILEILFLIPAVSNIFLGLFHLGERTDAVSLISPIKSTNATAPRNSSREVLTPEAIKEFTYFFTICKVILYVLPDFFLLTRQTERGYFVNMSSGYPIAILLAQIIGFTVGIIWFKRIKKYANSVRIEGKFEEAIDSMNSDNYLRYSAKTKIRSVASLLTLISIASIFTMELSFDNWSGINIVPHSLYIALMLGAVVLSHKHTQGQKLCYITGISAFVISIFQYVFYIQFLSKYSYEDISEKLSAREEYLRVELFASLELVAVAAFLFFFMRMMNFLVVDCTGIKAETNAFSSVEKAYHKSLKSKNLIIFAFGLISAIAKCLSAFINSKVQLIFTDETDVTMPSFSASIAPWYNLVITITSIIYIFFTFYYMSNLKDEVKMKYLK